MSARDHYEAWKTKKASAVPPRDFADGVMSRIHAGDRHGGQASLRDRTSPSGPLRWAAVAAVLVGLIASLTRFVCIIVLLLATPGKGN